VSDRFRDLEEPGKPGRKDAVLLATVSSFESIDHPTRRDLDQFCLLFEPLFQAAGADARRTAAAALSRSAHVPHTIARLIMEQPIDVAAPFLVHATGIGYDLLIDIVTRMGAAHARAVARRDGLSSVVVHALMRGGDPSVLRALTVRNLLPASPAGGAGDEQLRNQLRGMVMRETSEPAPSTAPTRLSPIVEDRLMRHARDGEPLYFATALADALGSSFELAERIMLDVSGRQLAETLIALGLRYTMIIVALEKFFPHLAQGTGTSRRSLTLLRGCSFVDCVERVTRWQRADLSMRRVTHQPVTVDLASPQHRRAAVSPETEVRKDGRAQKLRSSQRH
jgi:uncharacterized protein (DUF2336 family)